MKDICEISPLDTAEKALRWVKTMTPAEAQKIGYEIEEDSEVTCYCVEFGMLFDGIGTSLDVTFYYDEQGGYWLESIKWRPQDYTPRVISDEDKALIEELIEGILIRSDNGDDTELFRSILDEKNGQNTWRKYSLDTMQEVA